MSLMRCASPGCETEYFFITKEGQILCADCKAQQNIIPGLPISAFDEVWNALDDRLRLYLEGLNELKPNDYLRPSLESRAKLAEKIKSFFGMVSAQAYATETTKFTTPSASVLDDDDCDEEMVAAVGE